jgi:phage baseplate assembly protein W
MSNLLTRFIKDSVGTTHDDTDYKPVINSSGDFTKTIGIETIVNSWNTILAIPTRTYPWDPEFGCDLYKHVFDPTDVFTQEQIKDEIEVQLFGNDDRADLQNIDINFLRNEKGFTVDITVSYQGNKTNIKTVINEFNFLSVMG